jgi:hypothetical protein
MCRCTYVHGQDHSNLYQITTYALNIAGHDMQNRCAEAVHVEPAFNYGTEYQAFSRIYRIGQTQEVEVIRLFTEGTYQEIHEHFMLQKVSPVFAAFQLLHEASSTLRGQGNMTSTALAMSAFGMIRGRVKELKDVQSAKNVAKMTAKGKGRAAASSSGGS